MVVLVEQTDRNYARCQGYLFSVIHFLIYNNKHTDI